MTAKSATTMDSNGGQMLTAKLIDTGPQSLNGGTHADAITTAASHPGIGRNHMDLGWI